MVTGICSGEGRAKEFFFRGTRDFTGYLVVDKGFEYYDSFGVNSVHQYNKNLSIIAANKMAEIWKTNTLTSDVNLQCFLNNILVPSNDIDLCLKLAKKMLYQHNCYPIFYKFDNKVYCRITAQIYNELSDYIFAATKFLELLQESRNEQQQLMHIKKQGDKEDEKKIK